MMYDVFISHAWEDKDPFVKELAEKLISNRVEVWYDDISLKPGDSLRSSIDKGLSKSRFGIVILSHHFFSKQWTNWELDGLLQRHNNSEFSVIIPIWHNIDKSDIIDYSPSIANIVALRSTKGVDEIIDKILKLINPQGSSLVIARNILFKYNFQPPVVTDDWWLDIVEYSGTCEGLSRFEFPIPYYGNTPQTRGLRIAWAAMQNNWQNNADELGISQITHPKEVLKFISSQPGLTDICKNNIRYLIEYFPLLLIDGFGGEFEDIIEEYYQKSKIEYSEKRQIEDTGGSGLTTDKEMPLCDEMFALRNATFGNYRASTIACKFVQGELFGPTVRYYEHFDYLIWLLSHNSNWLPVDCRNFLIEGMGDWNVWLWDPYGNNSSFKSNNSTGSLWYAIYNCVEKRSSFKLTKKVITDIKTRIAFSCEELGIDDDVNTLFCRFIDSKCIETTIKEKSRKRR